jgi:hypothetical protein
MFILAGVAVLMVATGCGGSQSSAEHTGSAAQALAATCASGSTAQIFAGPARLVGCSGNVSWANRSTLCAPGFDVATADDYIKWWSNVTPLHDYWTNDYLLYSGAGPSNCSANYTSGFDCGNGRPMRVCTPGGTDAEGNTCTWTNCGLESTASAFFGGCAANPTAGTLCVPHGCANGTITENFGNDMVGCAGSVTWANRASLCAPGWRPVSAYEWTRFWGFTAPSHIYWTDDNLPYNGTASACYVDWNGFDCGSVNGSPTPMRVCPSSGTDAEGNRCNWTNCGLNSAATNQYFGGCVSNASAGTLCIPQGGCQDAVVTQRITSGVVGCQGIIAWQYRNALCAPGWSSTYAQVWANVHGSAVPQVSYWTNDNLNYLGAGSGNCAASMTSGTSCGTNDPMRLCPPTSPDRLGNVCNWTNCGLNANSPNQYFGGCVNNTSAGVLCGNADFVTVVDGFQNITTENFTSGSGDVADSCITAGTHRVMRFNFHSRNVGASDATLGSPPSDPNTYSPIFVWSQAHGHWHVRHYNVYNITNLSNSSITTGFKQAFCLEDYSQWNPGSGGPASQHYTCTNMGVSTGWEDIYYYYLPCQFINMDGLPDGDYLFTATTNASKVVEESDYSNNTTTARLTISGNTVTVH